MIALGNDHGGLELKNYIKEYLESNKIKYKDFGTNSTEDVDYPVYAKMVSESILKGESEKGFLFCGTGVGISIAANKIKGIRAALCHDVFSAKATRQHNNANILAMGGRVVGTGLALEIVKAFLETEFSFEERHEKRISQMEIS